MRYLLFASLLIIVAIGFLFQKKPSSSIPELGLVKGQSVERIEGIDHQVENVYGRATFLTLETMINDLGIIIFPEDKISAFPDPGLGLGSKIVIKRATPVIVNDATAETLYHTWATSIEQFLAEKKIVLGSNDLINPGLDSSLTPNLKITITRVDITEIKEKEAIAYKTISREDPDLEKGKTRITQEGIAGMREKTYKVRRENGVEVSRQLIKNEVLQQAQDKIVYKGTKTVIYGTGTATWYDWISGMTAAHNSLPYGTKVLVINLANNKSVEVKIVDHGIRGEAMIDLSREAFAKIASLSQGKITVRLEKP